MIRKNLFQTYLNSAKEASTLFYKNWIVLIAAVALYFALLNLSAIFASTGIVGSFINGLMYIAALTLFYSWLRGASPIRGYEPKELLRFDGEIFSNLLGVGFIMFLCTGLFSAVDRSLAGSQLSLFANLALVFAVNVAPEVVLINRLDSIHAITRSFQFVRDNFIEWFIPVIVFLLPTILIAPSLTLYFFAHTSPLLPTYMFYQSAKWATSLLIPILGIPIGVAFMTWVSFFRLSLFNKLG